MAQRLERRFPRSNRQHLIAVTLQQPLEEYAVHLLVVDDEDRSWTSCAHEYQSSLTERSRVVSESAVAGAHYPGCRAA